MNRNSLTCHELDPVDLTLLPRLPFPTDNAAFFQARDPLQRLQIRSPKPLLENLDLHLMQVRSANTSPCVVFRVWISSMRSFILSYLSV